MLLLLLTGCLGTETGNPPLTGDGVSSDALVASFQPTEGVQVLEFWVSFAEVRIIDGPSCERLHGTPTAMGRAGDLAAGLALGQLREGDACGLRVQLAPNDTLPDDAPPELRGATFFLRGLDPAARPFEVRSTPTEAIEILSDTRLTIDGATTIGFDVVALLAPLNIPSREADADGVVRVVDEPDARLGLARSVGLYVDLDEDGRLSPEEVEAGPLASHHP